MFIETTNPLESEMHNVTLAVLAVLFSTMIVSAIQVGLFLGIL